MVAEEMRTMRTMRSITIQLSGMKVAWFRNHMTATSHRDVCVVESSLIDEPGGCCSAKA
jgi:hypothetical protein